MVYKLTAWMFCRECNKFDDGEHPERPCSGRPCDFEVTDDAAFMAECNYEYDPESEVKDEQDRS